MDEHIPKYDFSRYVWEFKKCNGCDACGDEKCTEGAPVNGCSHVICHKCFARMHFGVVDEDFMSSIVEPVEPAYPFRDEYTNLLIFRSMGFESDRYKSWFIEDNQDLYSGLDNIEYEPIKQWFLTNERIAQYEIDMRKYREDFNDYENKVYELEERLGEERFRVKNTCMACSKE